MDLKDFKTASGKKLSEEELILEIENFILADNRFEYKIFVGSDSEARENSSDFVIAIVVHRVGHGARYFWKRLILPKFKQLRDRLWQEALFSLEISQKLLEKLLVKDLKFHFEVHLDIGENGKSQSVVKEIISLVRSYGLDFKIKPQSYAASKIADRLLPV
jgi:predicted RNase H-related nuclease YkuK (DUF458 family)